MSDIRIVLLRQNLAAFSAKLATASDKDQVQRQINATKKLLADEGTL
jgi:hypothetical protein